MNYPIAKAIKQHGVVLFIALIALVVMSLAAVALIRSVDTNSVIAGNLALKHSALVSSDRGVETAIAWISAKAGDKVTITDLDSDDTTKGYYATYLTLDLDNTAVLKDDATWSAANSAEAEGDGIVGGKETASGNNIRYIIQRMCRTGGTPDGDICLLGAADPGNNETGNLDDSELEDEPSQPSPMYRITTRVAGVKNTYSYAQIFVY